MNLDSKSDCSHMITVATATAATVEFAFELSNID